MKNTTAHRNSPDIIKVPLQSVTRTGKPIFAYLRRSTKKEEQRDSKQKQNDSIDLMAQDIGINIEDIRIFEDDYTAFEITTKNGTPLSKRKGWNTMMKEIATAKELCIILVYDISRLGRNTPDGVKVCELLGGYGNKAKVEYIRFYDGTKWDKHTSENEINTEFVKACAYSQALSKQKRDKNITSLRRGIMPKTIKTPHGLKATSKGMEETESMPFIYKAFELKAEGTLGKDISKYLSLHGIKIIEGNLAFMLFNKTQYVGEYTHPKTGDVFEGLIFTSGKTAIPQHLWDKVQSRLGKKVGGYGEKQQGDIIGKLLKWDEDKDKAFTLDIKTKPNGKQHKYYKSNFFGGTNISEKKIINIFIQKIGRTMSDVFKMKEKERREEAKKSILERRIKTMSDEEWDAHSANKFFKAQGIECSKETYEENMRKVRKDDGEIEFEVGAEYLDKILSPITYIQAISKIQESIGKIEDSPILQEKTLQKALISERKKQLESKKDELESDKKKLLRNAILGGFTKEEANEMMEDTEKEIQSIVNQIEELGEMTDIEQFIKRLPEVLNKTFELASKVLSKADTKDIQDDIYKLLEICTFELSVNNKKELTVKLFDGLECGKISVVGDIGFEPNLKQNKIDQSYIILYLSTYKRDSNCIFLTQK